MINAPNNQMGPLERFNAILREDEEADRKIGNRVPAYN